MDSNTAFWLNFAVALGIGLFVGAERERSKGKGVDRSAAGIRTFATAALLGAVSMTIHLWLVIAAISCVMIFAATAYFTKHGKDPGLTTEIALVLTVVLGALAINNPALASALAVGLAIILAAKKPIHGFISNVVSSDELNEFLILAAATLVILPIVPDINIGPFNAINLRNVWLVVIFVMLISALGHIALRLLGTRIGLPVVGFLSGFISSITTIGTMGQHAKSSASLIRAASAGAILSSLATVLQIAILLFAIHPPTLKSLLWPLIFGGAFIAIYGFILSIHAWRAGKSTPYLSTHAFSIKTAILLTIVIMTVVVSSATFESWFGQSGVITAAAIAAIVDVHAATISVATLASEYRLSTESTTTAILVALSVNATSKAVMAFTSGCKEFYKSVIPSLVVFVIIIWLAWWLI